MFIDALYRMLSAPDYQPLNQQALARKLKIPPGRRAEFTLRLEEEVARGGIVSIRNGLYVLPQTVGLLAGTFTGNERGFAFLRPDSFDGPDVYIAAGDTSTAMHGDHVLLRLDKPGQNRRRRVGRRGADGEEKLSGKVIRVLKRARTQIVGILQKTSYFHYVVPDDTRIPQDIYVPDPEPPIPIGHKVVARLRDWDSPHVNPEGEIVEVLGPPDQTGVDILAIIRKCELREAFPEPVLAEARRIPTAIPEEEIARREDFRSRFVFTIDPDDAKDFDDALCCRVLPNGDYEVCVHIADVSHYVKPGTAMEAEAVVRGNSTYLVDRVIPMLPEKLSNGICSLRPHEDRLVKTAVLRLSPDGQVKRARFVSGVIHSKKRLTYKQAMGYIAKSSRTPIGREVQRLHKIAQKLRARRFAQGALDLDFPEIKVRLDEAGRPVKIEKMENDESHQLIEEFMLLANEQVARHLKNQSIPAMYRVHEDPDPDRLEEYRQQAKALGFSVGDLTKRGEIQKLLKRAAGTPEEPTIKVNLLKSMKRAVYSPSPDGHYGLAKANYTHFTSPIRRYADLLVHRALFTSGKRRESPAAGQLGHLAVQLTRTEKNSSEAEMESQKLKKLEYFGRYVDDGRAHFRAQILEIRAFGLLVELPDYQLQGAIRMSDLQGDVYFFQSRHQKVVGRKTGAALGPGMSVRVGVRSVDFIKKQVNFFLPKPRKDTLKPPKATNERPGSSRAKRNFRPKRHRTGR
ncbi:MAG: ribonuclease R [Verrucomicrobiota bacterium]